VPLIYLTILFQCNSLAQYMKIESKFITKIILYKTYNIIVRYITHPINNLINTLIIFLLHLFKTFFRQVHITTAILFLLEIWFKADMVNLDSFYSYRVIKSIGSNPYKSHCDLVPLLIHANPK
jgi:hypothetical protein